MGTPPRTVLSTLEILVKREVDTAIRYQPTVLLLQELHDLVIFTFVLLTLQCIALLH